MKCYNGDGNIVMDCSDASVDRKETVCDDGSDRNATCALCHSKACLTCSSVPENCTSCDPKHYKLESKPEDGDGNNGVRRCMEKCLDN